jgi:cell division septal protein FtsQ
MNKVNFTDKEHKDIAYWERNQLILFLTRLFPSHLEKHPIEDKQWPIDLRNIIVVETSKGQMCWHISDKELKYFKHLKLKKENSWDGHTIEEKYERLKKLSKLDIN